MQLQEKTNVVQPVRRAVSNRQSAAIRTLEAAANKVEDNTKRLMEDDLISLRRLGTKTFLTLLDDEFRTFRTHHPMTLSVLAEFATESKRRAHEESVTTTTVMVTTPECPACRAVHTGYLVKFDKARPDYPYVVCGSFAKRVRVRLKRTEEQQPVSKDTKITLKNLRDSFFVPNFEITGGTPEDIEFVTKRG